MSEALADLCRQSNTNRVAFTFNLSPSQARMLQCIAQADPVATTEELGLEFSNVAITVMRLRRKLPNMIETRLKQGYYITPEGKRELVEKFQQACAEEV